MIIGCIIFIFIIIIILLSENFIHRHSSDIRCPKCGNYMSCYHFKYDYNDKEVNQYNYTCKNCGYSVIMKI